MKDALALALVHFIWQGTVLAVVAWALMRVAKMPSVRYAIGVATMAAMLAAPVLTFFVLHSGTGVTAQAVVGASAGQASSVARDRSPADHARPAGSVAVQPESRSLAVMLPTTWILSVWAFGVAVLSLRIAGGLVVAHRLATRSLTPVGEDLQRLAARLAIRLNVRAAVRVCESASVAVPIMTGWLRPVIVLPPAALVGLPAGQLEALLAHELAHIRRHDYLVNLLQTGVETLCFYHPAVWWVSREVRRHREYCCDDEAVGVCDRLTYVTALSALASISTPQFALAATGGSLRDRVQRLIEPTTHPSATKGAWMAMLPILLVVSFVAPHAWGDQSAPPAVPVVTVEPVVVQTVQAKPVPAVEIVVPVDVQRRERRAVVTRVRPQVERSASARPNVDVAARARTRVAIAPSSRPRTIERRVPVEATQAADAARRNREQEVARIRERRVALEVQTEQLAARQEIAALQSQLRRHEQALERSKELVEKGLATREAHATAEEQVAHARRQLEGAKAHMAIREQEHTLRRAEVEVNAERRAQGDVERRARAVARERSEPVMVELERADHLNLSALDGSASLQARDQLTITIADEPELPTHFTVRPDGSIRFPLLGSIRVQGSTTGQVQSAIQKLITDKGLARNPAVTVSARRGR